MIYPLTQILSLAAFVVILVLLVWLVARGLLAPRYSIAPGVWAAHGIAYSYCLLFLSIPILNEKTAVWSGILVLQAAATLIYVLFLYGNEVG